MMRKCTAFAAAIAALITAPAEAALVNFTINFTATNFFPNIGSMAAPYSPVTGSFTFSFDNSADIAPTTTGMTVNSFSLPADYVPSFTYLAASDLIAVGEDIGSHGCGVSAPPTQFCFYIDDASTAPGIFEFTYGIPSPSRIFRSENVQSFVPSAAVPEPATWAMMIAGFGAVGAALRRRSRLGDERERAAAA